MRKFNINVDGKNYVVEVEEIGGVSTVTTSSFGAAIIIASSNWCC